MAKKNKVSIQKSLRGKPIEVAVGEMKGVQAVVKLRAKEIEATAEEILEPHRFSGATEVRLERMKGGLRGIFAPGANGWRVTLIDTARGFEGAIEFGRKDFLIENSEEARNQGFRDAFTTRKTALGVYSRVKVRRALDQLYGGMDGLFILTKAVKAVRARHRREFR